MAEARIPEFFGDTQIREEVLDFMGLGTCMPREAWRLPSPQMLHQHYNALYGFMTMKEDVLRDYQKPKDGAQNTRQMNQALLLLKKIHPFHSRFLAHYETLYRSCRMQLLQ